MEVLRRGGGKSNGRRLRHGRDERAEETHVIANAERVTHFQGMQMEIYRGVPEGTGGSSAFLFTGASPSRMRRQRRRSFSNVHHGTKQHDKARGCVRQRRGFLDDRWPILDIRTF